MSNLRNYGMITESHYVGKTFEDASELAKNCGFTVRVVEKDGNAFIVTADVKTDRINFRLKNNIVIGVQGG